MELIRKRKRKNLDIAAIREQLQQEQERDTARYREQAERVALRIVHKIQDGRYSVDNNGKLVVRLWFCSMNKPLERQLVILLKEMGFVDAEWDSFDFFPAPPGFTAKFILSVVGRGGW